ncbi:MAG: sn-glycerol-3-phosphate ABC transporter ATP-binding protein UgpC [Pseudomonadota bacterium]
MIKVKLKQVNKFYSNQHCAVEAANFDIYDKELLVLVGPSGCGKSTLLRMIAGLESVSSGTIEIDGKIINDVDAKDRDIAMVFQSYALYPHMSVAENLAFSLQLRKLSKAEIKDRVESTANTLGLHELLERRPAQLSGGQRQRVALGRALIRKPSIFLLDEPLSNLDAKLRMSMRMEIARLHRDSDATMIYVTHDQIEAMTLGQRIVVFQGGKIQQIDTPLRLYAKPCNMFVAGFLGSPSMNFFHGKLAEEINSTSKFSLILDSARLPLPCQPGQVESLKYFLSQKIIVGIRPEDLLLKQQTQLGRIYQSFCLNLEAIEPVGNEIFLHLRFAGQEVIARVPPDFTPAIGQDVTLYYAAEKLHFFEAEHPSLRIDDHLADQNTVPMH